MFVTVQHAQDEACLDGANTAGVRVGTARWCSQNEIPNPIQRKGFENIYLEIILDFRMWE